MKYMTHEMSRTKKMILTGMFTAVLTVLSQIQLPMPSGVPLTLQTFAVALTGYILGWKRGVITVGIYLLLGAVGLPVFSGFAGGPGKLAGPAGGFLFGFLFLAALCGAASVWKNKVIIVLLPAVGLVCCHLFGTFHFQNLMGRTFQEAALLMSVPYFPKDAVSVAAAYLCAKQIKRRVYIG